MSKYRNNYRGITNEVRKIEFNIFTLSMNIFSVSIEMLLFKAMMDRFSKRKTNNTVILYTIVILGIVAVLLNLIPININIKLIILMIGYILVYSYNYEELIGKILIVYGIQFLILLATESIGFNIVLSLNNIEDYKNLYTNKIYYLEAILLTKGLLVIISFIIRSIQFKLNTEIKYKELIILGITIVANMLSIVMLNSFKLGIIDDSTKGMDLILTVSTNLSSISNIALVYIIIKIFKESQLRMENKMIRDKIKYQYNQYLQLQRAQLKVRQLYHDMNNHLVCIEKMNKLNEESKEYINNIKSELNNWKSINTTGNMIVDIILSEKKNICENNNIEFNANINFKECEFIDMVDVCTIFSNILDNSIEACNKIDNRNRYITISGNTINKFFIIKCENSKSNKIKKKQNNIFTDKKDKFIHGLGIKNIKECVKKYNGNVSIKYTEDKFTVSLLIPLIADEKQKQVN